MSTDPSDMPNPEEILILFLQDKPDANGEDALEHLISKGVKAQEALSTVYKFGSIKKTASEGDPKKCQLCGGDYPSHFDENGKVKNHIMVPQEAGEAKSASEKRCPTCNGTGSDPNNKDQDCPTCEGDGSVIEPATEKRDELQKKTTTTDETGMTKKFEGNTATDQLTFGNIPDIKFKTVAQKTVVGNPAEESTNTKIAREVRNYVYRHGPIPIRELFSKFSRFLTREQFVDAMSSLELNGYIQTNEMASGDIVQAAEMSMKKLMEHKWDDLSYAAKEKLGSLGVNSKVWEGLLVLEQKKLEEVRVQKKELIENINAMMTKLEKSRAGEAEPYTFNPDCKYCASGEDHTVKQHVAKEASDGALPNEKLYGPKSTKINQDDDVTCRHCGIQMDQHGNPNTNKNIWGKPAPTDHYFSSVYNSPVEEARKKLDLVLESSWKSLPKELKKSFEAVGVNSKTWTKLRNAREDGYGPSDAELARMKQENDDWDKKHMTPPKEKEGDEDVVKAELPFALSSEVDLPVWWKSASPADRKTALKNAGHGELAADFDNIDNWFLLPENVQKAIQDLMVATNEGSINDTVTYDDGRKSAARAKAKPKNTYGKLVELLAQEERGGMCSLCKGEVSDLYSHWKNEHPQEFQAALKKAGVSEATGDGHYYQKDKYSDSDNCMHCGKPRSDYQHIGSTESQKKTSEWGDYDVQCGCDGKKPECPYCHGTGKVTYTSKTLDTDREQVVNPRIEDLGFGPDGAKDKLMSDMTKGTDAAHEGFTMNPKIQYDDGRKAAARSRAKPKGAVSPLVERIDQGSYHCDVCEKDFIHSDEFKNHTIEHEEATEASPYGSKWNNATPLQRYFELNKFGLKGAEEFEAWTGKWWNELPLRVRFILGEMMPTSATEALSMESRGYDIKVVNKDSGEVIETLTASNQFDAELLSQSLSRNMNLNLYEINIVPAREAVMNEQDDAEAVVSDTDEFPMASLSLDEIKNMKKTGEGTDVSSWGKGEIPSHCEICGKNDTRPRPVVGSGTNVSWICDRDVQRLGLRAEDRGEESKANERVINQALWDSTKDPIQRLTWLEKAGYPHDAKLYANLSWSELPDFMRDQIVTLIGEYRDVNGQFGCDYCDQVFPHKNAVIDHMGTHSQAEKDEARRKRYSGEADHEHEWMPYMLGSQVCAKCGINRASTGYKYEKEGYGVDTPTTTTTCKQCGKMLMDHSGQDHKFQMSYGTEGSDEEGARSDWNSMSPNGRNSVLDNAVGDNVSLSNYGKLINSPFDSLPLDVRSKVIAHWKRPGTEADESNVRDWWNNTARNGGIGKYIGNTRDYDNQDPVDKKRIDQIYQQSKFMSGKERDPRSPEEQEQWHNTLKAQNKDRMSKISPENQARVWAAMGGKKDIDSLNFEDSRKLWQEHGKYPYAGYEATEDGPGMKCHNCGKVNQTGSMICPQCGNRETYKWTSEDNVTTGFIPHLSTVPTDQDYQRHNPENRCAMCGRTFNTLQDWKDHMQKLGPHNSTTPGANEADSEMDNRECPDCHKVFPTYEELISHVKKSLGDGHHPKALKNFMNWGGEADYPWDKCIDDNKDKGMDSARKICGSIKAKYGGEADWNAMTNEERARLGNQLRLAALDIAKIIDMPYQQIVLKYPGIAKQIDAFESKSEEMIGCPMITESYWQTATMSQRFKLLESIGLQESGEVHLQWSDLPKQVKESLQREVAQEKNPNAWQSDSIEVHLQKYLTEQSFAGMDAKTKMGNWVSLAVDRGFTPSEAKEAYQKHSKTTVKKTKI